MSKEQSNTFKKYRDADDAMGNLGWAAKMGRNAVRQAPEAPAEIETSFGFNERELLLWRLLKIARGYTDVENCGVLKVEKARCFLRGLVAADVLDMLDRAEGRSLLPLEIKRTKAKIQGKESKPSTKRKAIHERVFRPDIGLGGDNASTGNAAAPPPPVGPAAVESQETPNQKAADPLGSKDWEIKKAIDKAFAAMADQNHFGFLGVKQGSDAAAVKAAGLRLAREYHPDILAGTALANDTELVGQLDALFKRLQEARSVLGDEKKSKEYINALEAGTNRSAGKKVRRTAEAKVSFSKAEAFFKKKDYQSAQQHYRVAVDMDFDDPKLQVAYAWCIFLNENKDKKKRMDKAFLKLTTVVEKYKYGDAAYRLAMIARMEGDEKMATRRLKEAVRLDKKHVAAAQELRVAERRTNKNKEEKGGKGLFGKLLKR